MSRKKGTKNKGGTDDTLNSIEREARIKEIAAEGVKKIAEEKFYRSIYPDGGCGVNGNHHVRKIADKAIKEIKEVAEEKQKSVPVPDSRMISTRGNIIFPNKKQVLTVHNGLFEVPVCPDGAVDCSDGFVLVPCKREDLVEGDTAFMSDKEDTGFGWLGGWCNILDDKRYCYITGGDGVLVGTGGCKFWWKLKRKEETQK